MGTEKGEVIAQFKAHNEQTRQRQVNRLHMEAMEGAKHSYSNGEITCTIVRAPP